jgi:hypothetical protein
VGEAKQDWPGERAVRPKSLSSHPTPGRAPALSPHDEGVGRELERGVAHLASPQFMDFQLLHLSPAQWLPKPATSQFPESRRSLRELWSPIAWRRGSRREPFGDSRTPVLLPLASRIYPLRRENGRVPHPLLITPGVALKPVSSSSARNLSGWN